MMQIKHFLGAFLWLIAVAASAQKPLNPVRDTGPKSKVELLPGADSLVGLNSDFSLIKVFGDVKFRHRGAVLACRVAIQNSIANTIEAYGSIRITQGDTLTITGDTLLYDGNTRYARILGKKVFLRDKKIELQTTRLNYDMNSSDAYYTTRGRIKQDSSLLWSNKGVYNTITKIFDYEGDVEIQHPRYQLTTQKLIYDTNTGLATFATATTIKSKDGNITATSGTYNTRTQEANFSGRSMVANESYTLEADTLLFNRETDAGTAIGKVVFKSLTDKITLNGNRAIRDGKTGLTKMMGQSLLSAAEEGDTLFLRSDTLFTYEYLAHELPKTKAADSTKKKRNLKLFVADGNVKVYRTDIQSICDSLRYDLSDSTIRFFRNPLIWSTDTQFSADTIRAAMKQNRVRNVWLSSKSFVISQDSMQYFNQLKGRQIQAMFSDSSAIERIVVEGNGESLYYALDNDQKLIGLNRVTCSRMALSFKQKKVKRIAFIGNPEAVLYPPKEIDATRQRLDDFNWQPQRKPTKQEVINLAVTPPKPKQERLEKKPPK